MASSFIRQQRYVVWYRPWSATFLRIIFHLAKSIVALDFSQFRLQIAHCSNGIHFQHRWVPVGSHQNQMCIFTIYQQFQTLSIPLQIQTAWFNCHLLGASQKYPSFAGRCNFFRLFFKPLRGPFLIGRSIALDSSLTVRSSNAFELLATELFWTPWSLASLRFLLWLSTFLIGFMGFVNYEQSECCESNSNNLLPIVGLSLHFLAPAFFRTNSM